MRVLVAPQEFKGTLTAVEAALAVGDGVRRARPDWTVDLLPMADGGPGTLDALLTSAGGRRRRESVLDPLLRPVEADWGILNDGRAVIECAAASGLGRLSDAEHDAGVASSFGTGQLIGKALAQGCKPVLVGLGGSATNDAGAGMAKALGFRLLDSKGADLRPGGAALAELDSIVAPAAAVVPDGTKVLAITDVVNPLCGPEGASRIFGPQKGAGPAMIEALDQGLARLGAVVARDLGMDVMELRGGGAAGGLGAGLVAFLGAEIVPGAAFVGESVNLRQRIAKADVVLTGEGRLDDQSRFGKASVHIARLGRESGKRVICLAGGLGEGSEAVLEEFFQVETGAGPAGAVVSREGAERALSALARKVAEQYRD